MALTRSEINKRYYKKHKVKEKARNKVYYPKHYKKNGDFIRTRRRCYVHGCTIEWLERKLKEQKNCCAICNRVFEKTPHVDHDHTCCPVIKRFACGKCNRDLLCDDCNLGLGRFRDDVTLLENAKQYLRKHSKLSKKRTGNG